ncbi:uncharacterized protein VP01_8065g1 [Puccinia sorghi]|uniref:Uncharacterized protein n=1 Tax=Puccinia sorghi TaxID=27349 RepID=A0A0L6UAF8_9BASI|nr:uncharacterized protein VP01_8065g1 [Puccinia sorghi]
MDQIPDSPPTPRRGQSLPTHSFGPNFCTQGMKPPDTFDSENSSKLRGFLQSCKLLFSNDPQMNTRRSSTQPCTWAVEPPNGSNHIYLLENQSPSCLIKHWDRFKQQLFTLFGDPNEV